MKNEARIWPSLSYMCHIHSTADRLFAVLKSPKFYGGSHCFWQQTRTETKRRRNGNGTETERRGNGDGTETESSSPLSPHSSLTVLFAISRHFKQPPCVYIVLGTVFGGGAGLIRTARLQRFRSESFSRLAGFSLSRNPIFLW